MKEEPSTRKTWSPGLSGRSDMPAIWHRPWAGASAACPLAAASWRLASDGASHRLRWPPVDPDEGPSHVLGAAEPDGFGDPLDRFGCSFYAATRQVGAKSLYDARGRGARLRPECPAELAHAHARRL